MAKIGVNDRTDEPAKIPVSFVIVDNEPHLTERGVAFLSKWVEKLYVVTTNPSHPSYLSDATNVTTIACDSPIDFPALFLRLGEEFGIERMTVQSGGTLNATLVRAGLIDHLSIVVAPVIVGGKDTPSLVGGESLHAVGELGKLRALRLVAADALEGSYLHVRYDVKND
jgi:2,5-diamino-6-(ribosylamino)-4(3H)-pyrimidinone 5'-phosphate reductase